MEIIRYKPENHDNLKNQDEEKLAIDLTSIIEAQRGIASIPDAKNTPIPFGNKV
jgi:hypothetical protein